ncbi:hypothetical protein JDV02_007187 [Purpureocillium takamizusanense]|uniref:Uncharacterized protein n=1 Tax=Purpureocillium takamizusanense TaxID=2060973 RepID=A0A9Q8QHS8_9HYPO|nr:uncharacterized protein JDV02_007187 [Purpureocillium takamizusanense]UNI21174.1 hypothetical protein JDV02_007187 [Purpureocillium takamizusanense]
MHLEHQLASKFNMTVWIESFDTPACMASDLKRRAKSEWWLLVTSPCMVASKLPNEGALRRQPGRAPTRASFVRPVEERLMEVPVARITAACHASFHACRSRIRQ